MCFKDSMISFFAYPLSVKSSPQPLSAPTKVLNNSQLDQCYWWYWQRLDSTAKSSDHLQYKIVLFVISCDLFSVQTVNNMKWITVVFMFVIGLLTISYSPPTSNQTTDDVLQFERKSTGRALLHIHGKWCGPKTTSFPTDSCLDALDCICKDHDICYWDHFTHSCKCDADVVRAIAESIAKGNMPIDLLHKAALIKHYFTITVCSSPTHVPGVKTCRKCFRQFRRRRCINYPCGVEWKCWKTPRVGKLKMLVRRYSCWTIACHTSCTGPEYGAILSVVFYIQTVIFLDLRANIT